MQVEYYVLSKYATVRRNLLSHNINNVSEIESKINKMFSIYTSDVTERKVGRPYNKSISYKIKILKIDGTIDMINVGNKKRAREVTALIKKSLITITNIPIMAVQLLDKYENLIHFTNVHRDKKGYAYNVTVATPTEQITLDKNSGESQ